MVCCRGRPRQGTCTAWRRRNADRSGFGGFGSLERVMEGGAHRIHDRKASTRKSATTRESLWQAGTVAYSGKKGCKSGVFTRSSDLRCVLHCARRTGKVRNDHGG